MKTTISVGYSCPPETLLSALIQQDFHEAKIKALGALSSEVLSCSATTTYLSIHVRRHMRNTAPVPTALRKLLPEVTVIEHRDEWSAQTRSGSATVSLAGVPVGIAMSMVVRPSPAGATVDHQCRVESRVPLIGGALERFVAAQLAQQLQQEAAIAQGLLEMYV